MKNQITKVRYDVKEYNSAVSELKRQNHGLVPQIDAITDALFNQSGVNQINQSKQFKRVWVVGELPETNGVVVLRWTDTDTVNQIGENYMIVEASPSRDHPSRQTPVSHGLEMYVIFGHSRGYIGRSPSKMVENIPTNVPVAFIQRKEPQGMYDKDLESTLRAVAKYAGITDIRDAPTPSKNPYKL